MAKTLIFLIFKNPRYGSKWLPVPWSLAYAAVQNVLVTDWLTDSLTYMFDF